MNDYRDGYGANTEKLQETVNRMIYFTSDLHLGHRGIITMQERPFADVEEMNKMIS